MKKPKPRLQRRTDIVCDSTGSSSNVAETEHMVERHDADDCVHQKTLIATVATNQKNIRCGRQVLARAE